MCRPDRALLAPQPAHDCGLQHGFSRIRQVIFLPYWINIVQDGFSLYECSRANSRRQFRAETRKSSSESDDEDALRCARGSSER
jgi:hypothetical protein